MAGKCHDAAGHGGPHDPAVNDGTHVDAGAAPAAADDDVPAHSAHDAAAATTSMGDECQRQHGAISKWQWKHECQWDGHGG